MTKSSTFPDSAWAKTIRECDNCKLDDVCTETSLDHWRLVIPYLISCELRSCDWWSRKLKRRQRGRERSRTPVTDHSLPPVALLSVVWAVTTLKARMKPVGTESRLARMERRVGRMRMLKTKK